MKPELGGSQRKASIRGTTFLTVHQQQEHRSPPPPGGPGPLPPYAVSCSEAWTPPPPPSPQSPFQKHSPVLGAAVATTGCAGTAACQPLPVLPAWGCKAALGQDRAELGLGKAPKHRPSWWEGLLCCISWGKEKKCPGGPSANRRVLALTSPRPAQPSQPWVTDQGWAWGQTGPLTPEGHRRGESLTLRLHPPAWQLSLRSSLPQQLFSSAPQHLCQVRPQQFTVDEPNTGLQRGIAPAPAPCHHILSPAQPP